MTEAAGPGLRVAILVTSDRAARGERADATGPALREFLLSRGSEVVELRVVPDERDQVAQSLRELCGSADLVVTAGGTGLGERDVTPEATATVVERQVPGIAEAMRAAGLRSTPHAMLSRGIAGVRGMCLIVNLPGSPRGAMESLEAVWAGLPHAAALIKGTATDRDHAHR